MTHLNGLPEPQVPTYLLLNYNSLKIFTRVVVGIALAVVLFNMVVKKSSLVVTSASDKIEVFDN